MKYVGIGFIIYIIVIFIIGFLLYKNGSSLRVKVSDQEYNDFLLDMKKQKEEKLNKKNKRLAKRNNKKLNKKNKK